MASFNKNEYRRASHQKFNAASDADRYGHFAVAHYLAGVSVECMLRAYRWSIDPSWDEKHDLVQLMKKSGVLVRIPARRIDLVSISLNEIARRWSVSHRYAPSDRLEAHLRIVLGRSDRRILRDNSQDMIGFAQAILQECDKRCP